LISRRTQRTGRDELGALKRGLAKNAAGFPSVCALAPLKQESVRSCPSRIAELQCDTPVGIAGRRDRERAARTGRAIVLVRERSGDEVSYRRREFTLATFEGDTFGLRCVDDGHLAIAGTVKRGWFSANAQTSSARMIVVHDRR
jgi:hypothetical protein